MYYKYTQILLKQCDFPVEFRVDKFAIVCILVLPQLFEYLASVLITQLK